MILHKNNELFFDLIELTAAKLNIPAIYVEKDYWVTYILKRLSNSKYSEVAIFKGGTSLSKAYKIIDRFSEDIDLAVIRNDLTNNQIKKLIKDIEKELLDDNFNEIISVQTSKGSQFRKTVHQYAKSHIGNFGHANENILIELNSFAHPHPYLKKSISTYIYDFLKDTASEFVYENGLEPFDINVLDYRRTFCEKISATARASFESNNELVQLKEKIRHFYDIYFLMQEEDIKSFLLSSDFIEMIQKVRIDDQSQFNNTDWANVPLFSTEIFTNTKEILYKLENFYLNDFKSLVYVEYMPTIKSLEEEISYLAKVLKENKL